MKKALLTLALLIAPACSSSSEVVDGGGPVVDILADTNRNGQIDWTDPTEEANKTVWNATQGAIFLANIDDSAGACVSTTSTGDLLSDAELPLCNDAADTVVNGPMDLLDLAPLGIRGWPRAPAGTLGTVSVDTASAPFIHLFIQRDGALTFFDWQNGDRIQTAELRAGNVIMAIEATDVVRDPTVWNGYTTVTLSVNVDDAGASKTDSVILRVAPIVTRHQLAPEEQMFVTAFADDEGSIAMRSALYSDMAGTGEGDGGVLPPTPSNVTEINGDESFAGNTYYDDRWTQDFFEVGYMSMPTTGGQQHIIDVYLRSANIYTPTDVNNQLRPAGKVVFAKFRGPGAAGVQQYDIASDPDMDSLNSLGNLETIPPYSLNGVSYPLGRLFRGDIPTWHPDSSFEKMMEAQLVQPPVYIDTSWLFVGHVDETTSFLTASSPRGWVLLLNDPALAVTMLEEQVTAGNGDVLMFAGENWLDDGNPTPAQISINDALADVDILSTSNAAVASVNAELQVIQTATGLTDAEIIHIPYLYQPVQGGALAWQPGTVNGLYYAANTFAAPDPHGPIINGVDIFKAQMQTALSAVGINVVWVEDWDLYHRLSGEVHCGTNSKRGLAPNETWWTSGYD